MRVQTIIVAFLVILAILWASSNPAHAGDVVHNLWTSALTFLSHTAKGNLATP